MIGVTRDFPTSQMSNPREQLLLSLAQYPDLDWSAVPAVDDFERGRQIMLIARSEPGEQPETLRAALENVVRERDPEFVRTSIVTGVGLWKNSVNDFLTQSMVAGATGGVILMLAALGIYGVVGLMATARTREIAVRVALGATRRRVLGMILFDVVKLVAPGVAAGLILAGVLVRINVPDLGYSLSDAEALAFVFGGAAAILVAILASFLPARRAASVQPMVAMRTE